MSTCTCENTDVTTVIINTVFMFQQLRSSNIRHVQASMHAGMFVCMQPSLI